MSLPPQEPLVPFSKYKKEFVEGVNKNSLLHLLWGIEQAVFCGAGSYYRQLGITIMNLTGGYELCSDEEKMRKFNELAMNKWKFKQIEHTISKQEIKY